MQSLEIITSATQSQLTLEVQEQAKRRNPQSSVRVDVLTSLEEMDTASPPKAVLDGDVPVRLIGMASRMQTSLATKWECLVVECTKEVA